METELNHEQSGFDSAAETEAWKALESELGDDSGGAEPTAQAEPEQPDADGPPQDDPGSQDGKPDDKQLASQYQAAMREERQRRQHVEQQLNEINKAIQEAKAARQQQEQPQPPSLDDDPVAYFDHRTKQLEEQQLKFNETLQQSQEQQRQAYEAQQFQATLAAGEDEFARASPDYYEAADHLRNIRMGQLSELYPSTPEGDYYAQQYGYANAEQMRQAHLSSEVATYANHALQMGRNPAEVFYNLAKSTGWSGAKQVTPEQKMEVARGGARRAQSLSGGGAGGGVSGNATAAELADLYETDPEAADKLFDKLAASGALG